MLVLSLFPGIGLLDRAFEAEGFTIVRGPDLLFGGDIRRFHAKPGIFDGVIGGPPCQRNSAPARFQTIETEDLIAEFVRVTREAQPSFVVMENVRGARGHAAIPPDWHFADLRDFDCGGLTKRRRAFWTWPMMILEPGGRCPGKAAATVMASSWKRGKSSNRYCADKGYLPGDLPIREYARLQGAEELGAQLEAMQAGRGFAVHVLGNGVPLAMGRFVARSVRAALKTTNEGRT